jgi:hypothetical protein
MFGMVVEGGYELLLLSYLGNKYRELSLYGVQNRKNFFFLLISFKESDG